MFDVQSKVIDPFVEIRACSMLHFAGQPACKLILVKESKDELSQQFLGFIGQRPVKCVNLLQYRFANSYDVISQNRVALLLRM